MLKQKYKIYDENNNFIKDFESNKKIVAIKKVFATLNLDNKILVDENGIRYYCSRKDIKGNNITIGKTHLHPNVSIYKYEVTKI